MIKISIYHSQSFEIKFHRWLSKPSCFKILLVNQYFQPLPFTLHSTFVGFYRRTEVLYSAVIKLYLKHTFAFRKWSYFNILLNKSVFLNLIIHTQYSAFVGFYRVKVLYSAAIKLYLKHICGFRKWSFSLWRIGKDLLVWDWIDFAWL